MAAVQDADEPILLVDDDAAVRRVVREALARALACKVVEFADGHEAIEMAKTSRFSVAVLDVEMPTIDGAELAARLLAIDPDLPVVFLTGSLREDLTAQLEKLGRTVLRKPVEREELVGVVDSYRRRG